MIFSILILKRLKIYLMLFILLVFLTFLTSCTWLTDFLGLNKNKDNNQPEYSVKSDYQLAMYNRIQYTPIDITVDDIGNIYVLEKDTDGGYFYVEVFGNQLDFQTMAEMPSEPGSIEFIGGNIFLGGYSYNGENYNNWLKEYKYIFPDFILVNDFNDNFGFYSMKASHDGFIYSLASSDSGNIVQKTDTSVSIYNEIEVYIPVDELFECIAPVNEDEVYVAYSNSENKITKYSINDGSVLKDMYEDKWIIDAVCDSAGNLYVALETYDGNNYHDYIKKYDADGEFVTEWSIPPYQPAGIAVDNNEAVYIIFATDKTVYKYE